MVSMKPQIRQRPLIIRKVILLVFFYSLYQLLFKESGLLRITESYNVMASLNFPWERREFARSRSAAGSDAEATTQAKREDAVLAMRRKGVRRTNMVQEEGTKNVSAIGEEGRSERGTGC
jgi:hypothetical protein